MSVSRYDEVVVGAGILGLAGAYTLARRGRRVAVVERSPRAQGASVRNFGMLWPIGQPLGPRRDLALRGLAIWREILPALGAWHDPCGSLHVAYHDDEAAVLSEFADLARPHGAVVELLDPSDALRRSPYLVPDGLRAALWSPDEVCIDPREVVARLPGWLSREHGVAFHFDHAALAYAPGRLRTSRGAIECDRLVVCSGTDFQTLYPEHLQDAGIVPCKLQMLRTAPLAAGPRLGPMLAAGLTLRHYAGFAACPSLPALRGRFAREEPRFDHYGIHVMVAQNGAGELVLGDSHEYGDAVEPFDKDEIDALILGYLRGFLRMPDVPIAARWHGIYGKHPDRPWIHLEPEPGVTVLTGVGGAGMTLSFGLAEQVLS